MASRPSATCATSTITTRCVCVLFSSLSLNRHSRMMIFGGEGGGFFRTASSSQLSFPIHITDPRFVSATNNTQHVSTPTYMPSDVNVCREYQHEACCSLETVRKCVFFLLLFFPQLFLFRGRRERERRDRGNPLSPSLSLSFLRHRRSTFVEVSLPSSAATKRSNDAHILDALARVETNLFFFSYLFFLANDEKQYTDCYD